MALVHQLHQLFPGWAADLNARDGAVIAEIRYQLEKRAAWAGAFLRPVPSLVPLSPLPGRTPLLCGAKACEFRRLAAAAAQSYLRRMATNFTPDEEVEIALLLWEYERDGAIAIDNFIRREPGLSLRMASGVLPVGVQRTIIEYIKKQRR
jgi:hypothetical protein